MQSDEDNNVQDKDASCIQASVRGFVQCLRVLLHWRTWKASSLASFSIKLVLFVKQAHCSRV